MKELTTVKVNTTKLKTYLMLAKTTLRSRRRVAAKKSSAIYQNVFISAPMLNWPNLGILKVAKGVTQRKTRKER